MVARTTKGDVDAAFEALCKVATSMGFDCSRWQLHHGSVTYGRAYRIYDDGASVLGLSQGFVGLTAREAYERMWAMHGALWEVRELHKGYFVKDL